MKQLLKLQPQCQVTVRDAVVKLAAMPDASNVKTLTHHQYGYRLRVGNYRVLFDWQSTIKIISVQEVRKRDERTY